NRGLDHCRDPRHSGPAFLRRRVLLSSHGANPATSGGTGGRPESRAGSANATRTGPRRPKTSRSGCRGRESRSRRGERATHALDTGTIVTTGPVLLRNLQVAASAARRRRVLGLRAFDAAFGGAAVEP